MQEPNIPRAVEVEASRRPSINRGTSRSSKTPSGVKSPRPHHIVHRLRGAINNSRTALRISCMNGSIAYMAKHKARGVGIGQEGRIRARVVADFFLVRLQRGDDRTALLALGERLGGDGALRLVIWFGLF